MTQAGERKDDARVTKIRCVSFTGKKNIFLKYK